MKSNLYYWIDSNNTKFLIEIYTNNTNFLIEIYTILEWGLALFYLDGNKSRG